jgi:hypothetical protein
LELFPNSVYGEASVSHVEGDTRWSGRRAAWK